MLTEAGAVFSCGRGDDGQLGHGDEENQRTPKLIKALRGLSSYQYTPLLMLTTESSMERKSEGKAAGATGWIVKPFEPENLVATVRRVLG